MAQPAILVSKPDGDYTVRRSQDNSEQRQDAERQLRENGCKRFRHDSQDGKLVTHGWVRE